MGEEPNAENRRHTQIGKASPQKRVAPMLLENRRHTKIGKASPQKRVAPILVDAIPQKRVVPILIKQSIDGHWLA